MRFKNRLDGARHLFPFLKKYTGSNTVVLGIPRGAVSMAGYLAERLHASFGILPIKKISHPLNPELSVGSVSLEGRTLDPHIPVDSGYLESEIILAREVLKSRKKMFEPYVETPELENKTVIIVDDGIATGNTILAAVAQVRRQKPGEIIIAAPVGSPDALRKLRGNAGKVICLTSPTDFISVGQFYDQFPQVSDEDVLESLKELQLHHVSV
jgi:putative phosphoribosyl transferase